MAERSGGVVMHRVALTDASSAPPIRLPFRRFMRDGPTRAPFPLPGPAHT